jgi:ABC-type polysaccharide/polyol phosphate export permease
VVGAGGAVIALGRPISELLRFRELIAMLVTRDLKVRYKRSVFGMLWTLLNPLLQMAVYTFVFSIVMRVNIPAYPIYLLSGLLPWMLISVASTCTHALIDNQALIRKVAVPQAVYPLSVVGSKLVDVLLSFIPLALLATFLGRPPGPSWLAVVPALLVATAFTTGLALVLASLTTFFRDVRHLSEILFQIWFYVTPIFYSYEHLASLPYAWAPRLLVLNPAAPIVRMFQQALYEGRFPDAATFALAAAWGAGALLVGFVAFTRAEPRHIHNF